MLIQEHQIEIPRRFQYHLTEEDNQTLILQIKFHTQKLICQKKNLLSHNVINIQENQLSL